MYSIFLVREGGLEPPKAFAIGASVLLLRPNSDIPAHPTNEETTCYKRILTKPIYQHNMLERNPVHIHSTPTQILSHNHSRHDTAVLQHVDR
jgi:hypothetical protein